MSEHDDLQARVDQLERENVQTILKLEHAIKQSNAKTVDGVPREVLLLLFRARTSLGVAEAELTRLRVELERQTHRLPDFYREVFGVEFPGDNDARSNAKHILSESRRRCGVAEKTLRIIADAPANGPDGSLYYELQADDGQVGCMHVDPIGWIGDASNKARAALAELERGKA